MGGNNRYSYVLNNPIRYIDPLGLVTFNIGGNVTGVVGETGSNPGGVAGGGSYLEITFSGVEIGGYTLEGNAAGLDLDASVVIGVTFDSADFSGKAASAGFDAGPVSININLSTTENITIFGFETFIPQPVGVEIGFSPPQAGGYSFSETTTSPVPVFSIDFSKPSSDQTNAGSVTTAGGAWVVGNIFE